MRRNLAFAITILVSFPATAAFAQCASCGAPSHVQPVYSAPIQSPIYSAPIQHRAPIAPMYGSPCANGTCGHPGHARSHFGGFGVGTGCPGGNCGLGGLGGGHHGLGGGYGCPGGNCGGGLTNHVHGTFSRLWDMEQRKNRWLLTHFGVR